LLSSNQNILPSDQNLRQYEKILPNTNNFNLDGNVGISLPKEAKSLTDSYFNLKSMNINDNIFTKVLSNQINLPAPYAPIFDTHTILSKPLDYDKSNVPTLEIQTTKDYDNSIKHTHSIQKSNDISLLKGKRDGAPEFLNAAY